MYSVSSIIIDATKSAQYANKALVSLFVLFKPMYTKDLIKNGR